ncbi:hypothetical protein B1748_01130 [Paenibacillus sp. MY03]|uniref:Solute-binding protein family 3/N-terminal domain-containing protein n=1 Tax=Paenibacillus agaridevorans TaxID=171404 RepID=A0A2R5ESX4_9BACL|nr:MULTISPECIES: transporter substrate-binding domain-containing protein [Paenibacillus]OUS78708.1 hypothetical protein B1748_01130 [Paenibacillus sp. MY03]GBG09796.1 hypothetical protein PAT3040_04465 [Paenibacillus agaridevorans]
MNKFLNSGNSVKRNGRYTILLLVAMMLWISACGGANTPPAVQSTEKAAQTEEPAKSSAVSTLDRIKERGKIIIGTTATSRPTHFTNENGELDGYDIDWGKLIAEELGVEAEFVAGAFSGLVPGLVAEQYDVVISALVITEERKEMIDFTDIYMTDGAVAIVKEDNDTVTGLDDLTGLTVGVLSGSGFVEDVKAIGGYKELREYPGNPEGYIDLKAGRVDVYVAGKTGASDFIKYDEGSPKLKMVGDLYNMKYDGIGLRKNEPELLAALNDIIAARKEDGTYDELAMKWFGYAMPH